MTAADEFRREHELWERVERQRKAEAVAIFKAAWHRADEAGDKGHRVEAGIQALIDAGWGPATSPRVPRITSTIDAEKVIDYIRRLRQAAPKEDE